MASLLARVDRRGFGYLALMAAASCGGSQPTPCAEGTFGADCTGSCDCGIGAVCDDGAEGIGTCSNNYALSLEFVRLDSATPNPFRVMATLQNNGIAVPGVALTVGASAGTVSAVRDMGGGDYAFTVTPTQTGEHEVTVTYDAATVSQTAVVMESVASDWGQPPHPSVLAF